MWTVPAPEIDPIEARRELARRYLHVFGPTTPSAFATWAGISDRAGRATFADLNRSLVAVRTPIGDALILVRDEPGFRAQPGPPAAARLLPSGDACYLLQEADRELLVPDARLRGELGPRASGRARCWSRERSSARGAVPGPILSIQTWRRLTRAERDAVETEAHSMPLPGIDTQIAVRWAA